MNKLADYVDNGNKVPTKACALTFDDGTRYEYEYALPVLDEFRAVATFYIITDRVNSNSYYMNWEQLDSIVSRGHALGSHTRTVTYGMNTENLSYKDLYNEIQNSKENLESRGYICKSLAYPLGQWNDNVIKIMKETGYKIGRAIGKFKDDDDTSSGSWRDRRALTFASDENYKWHFSYFKPEKKTLAEIQLKTQYTGWWQFEEFFTSEYDIRLLSSLSPSLNSYGVASLDSKESLTTSFNLKYHGKFLIEIILNGNIEDIDIFLNDNKYDLIKGTYCEQLIKNDVEYDYCSYYIKAQLPGEIINFKVHNKGSTDILLDRYRVFSDINQNFYDITPYFLPENNELTREIEPNFNTYKVQEDFIPIIGYHRIIPDDLKIDKPSIQVKAKDFEKQMDFFTNEMKCVWITMDTLSKYITNKEKVPTKACVLTFDDGTHFEYENALPILDKYKAVATFYITTKHIGTKSFYMNWDQIEQLYKRGHDIGSHTRDVFSGVNSENLNYNQLMSQISGSKKDLEDRGYKCSSFAYPLGEWNDNVIEILKSSGYKIGRAIQKYKTSSGDLIDTWREKRPLTISPYEDKYMWHFHYIKPDGLTPQEISEKIRYTGWWQFEEDYLPKITDYSSNQHLSNINVRSSIDLPSEQSYGVVELPSNGYQITNNFITKTKGSFSIELVYHGDMVNIVVKVDDVEVKQYKSNKCKIIGVIYYCSYYVDIELNPGVHQLSVENKSLNKALLDRFRIFSNMNQNFYDFSDYIIPEYLFINTEFYIYIFAIIIPVSLVLIFSTSVIIYYQRRRNMRIVEDAQNIDQLREIRVI